MFACRAIVLLAGSLAIGGTPLVCGADDRADAVVLLLDEGWSVTPQARQAADSQLAKLQQIAPEDALSLNAGWLVLMHQRRFEEALRTIERHLKVAPDDLRALRAKAWIQTVLKNYPAAMLTAERMSVALGAPAPGSVAPADDGESALREASVGFLGRLLGFLGGPVDGAVHQLERRRLEKRVVDRLDEAERVVFEEARNAVLARFVELTDETSDSTEKALAAATAEREKTLAEIQADRDRLGDREKELDDRRKKLQDELQAELASIDRQEQPLVQQQVQLSARAEVLNADLFNYSSQILTLESLAAREKDAGLRQQYLNQIASLSIIASRIEGDLYSLNRQLQALQGQRVGLQARRRQANVSTSGQLERATKELAELDRRGRRNEGLERRASRPITASTSKTLSLSAQATALSTYDAFPLEAEKARILGALK